MDQLSDMLARIKNGQKRGLSKILLYKPTSKLCLQVLKILYSEGYIRGFKLINIKPLTIEIFLKYTATGEPTIKKLQRISKPSRRFYIKIKPLWNLKSGLGIFIISTPQGLMTDSDAKILNQGGEILCSVL